MDSKSRIVKNTSIAVIYEIIAIIAGLILPRIILTSFGSSYNGIVSSVTQFLSFVVLLRSGIGGVAKSFLYKSLKENDVTLTSRVMRATRVFMNKVCVIFILGLLSMSLVYPFIVRLPWLSTALLVVICGIASLVENYFGITSMILLQADRREYLISIGDIIVTVANVIITALLVYLNCSIHLVKLGSAIVFSIKPVFLYIYVNRHYKLIKQIDYEPNLLQQKSDAFIHVIAEFIHRNTDVVVLTLLTNTLVVSVYSIYAIVVNGLRRLTNAFTANIEAVMGHQYNNDRQSFLNMYENFELLVFLIGTIIYTTCGYLFIPFIKIYTRGVTDINYAIPPYAILCCVGEYFDLAKTPYQFVIRIAGRFKETKYISVGEACINIVISIILVIRLGIIGVAVGTVIAMIWRTIGYSTYVHKNIIGEKEQNMFCYIAVSLLVAGLVAAFEHYVYSPAIDGYISFIVHGLASVLIISVFTLLIYYVFFKNRLTKSLDSIVALIFHR